MKGTKRRILFSFLAAAGVVMTACGTGDAFRGAASLKTVYAAPETASVRQEYAAYRKRLENIKTQEEIEPSGFELIREQRFPVYLEQFGEVMFTPAMEKKYNRLVLFFVDGDGKVVYQTDQLETNNKRKGSLAQNNTGLSAVSFQDMNGDGLWDLVLLTSCEKKEGTNAGKNYRVGDVLFQGEKCFYRDWRVSDKINRFNMNRSIELIAAYVRDGRSTEFLYTASTMDELLSNGLQVVSEQCYWRNFEKLGRLLVVPGTYPISNYEMFLVYLVNEEGNIVWSFQPMEEYDNLYALRGISCRDIDGDGLKDLVVMARYSYAGEGPVQTEMAYSIYYQRVSGFVEDTEVKAHYVCQEDETMEELVNAARACWGWSTEDD